MSSNISIDPVVGQPHLALDIVQHLVAQVLDLNGNPNFADGCSSFKDADPAKIYLYPFYLEDKPDNCGVVRTRDKQANGNNPQRQCSVTIAFRMPSVGGVSGQKRSVQACEAILTWLRPGGVLRTETDGGLPSGRLARRWQNPVIETNGEDSQKRFSATINFELLYLDINVP